MPRGSDGDRVVSVRSEPRGSVVYAAAAGLSSAVPLPVVDAVLGKLARGAAMRRAAARHGVVLTSRARDVLARPGAARVSGTLAVRLVRSAITRVLAPVRIAARAEDALSTFAATLLVDHYLATSARTAGAPLDEEEATRVREAIDAAIKGGTADVARGVPIGAWNALVRAVRAARDRDGAEERNILERAGDALLDSVADAPAEASAALCSRFDAAITNEP